MVACIAGLLLSNRALFEGRRCGQEEQGVVGCILMWMSVEMWKGGIQTATKVGFVAGMGLSFEQFVAPHLFRCTAVACISFDFNSCSSWLLLYS